jgi:hypothetical protein
MRWIIFGSIVCAAALGSGLMLFRGPGPSDVQRLLNCSEHFELYSISPEEGPLTEGGPVFHGYGIYGKTTINSQAVRTSLASAIDARQKGPRSKCFAPRHAIRATS